MRIVVPNKNTAADAQQLQLQQGNAAPPRQQPTTSSSHDGEHADGYNSSDEYEHHGGDKEQQQARRAATSSQAFATATSWQASLEATPLEPQQVEVRTSTPLVGAFCLRAAARPCACRRGCNVIDTAIPATSSFFFFFFCFCQP